MTPWFLSIPMAHLGLFYELLYKLFIVVIHGRTKLFVNDPVREFVIASVHLSRVATA